MTLEHPVDTPPAELLRAAREAAWSDDESVGSGRLRLRDSGD